MLALIDRAIDSFDDVEQRDLVRRLGELIAALYSADADEDSSVYQLAEDLQDVGARVTSLLCR